MQVVIAPEAEVQVQSKGNDPRPGATRRQILVNELAPDGLNFVFYRSTYQAGDDAFVTPRHHHGFQQIRWTEQGEVNYAPGQSIREGDIAYFPRGAYYGPQEKEQGVAWLIQFGFHGEHMYGPAWWDSRKEAMDRLKAEGEFRDGYYVYTDSETGQEVRRDAADALHSTQFEIHSGRPFSIPPEGYDAPILMHAKNFGAYEASPGVNIQPLGNFFDHPAPSGDVRFSVVTVTSNGRYVLDPERAQLGWSLDAGLVIDGETYPELTAFYSPRDEKVELSGSDLGVRFHLVELPRLD